MIFPHRPSNLSILLYSVGSAIPHIISFTEMPQYAHQIVLTVSNIFLISALILAQKNKIDEGKPDVMLDNFAIPQPFTQQIYGTPVPDQNISIPATVQASQVQHENIII